MKKFNEGKLAKTLFDEYILGDLKLRNRFVMSALTRTRADPVTLIPNDLHVTYYSQRATYAGLLLSECSPISNNSQAFIGAGGIFTKEQADGWKRVLDAVHAKNSHMFLQIWHGGRAAHPFFIKEDCIAPSPIAIPGLLKAINQPYGVPREMTKEDIKLTIEQFRQGALRAKEAGFDGLELHGANGYLVDQFLQDNSNRRTDEYGGSIENRARFCLEAIDALVSVFGAKRVGIKLSPVSRFQDMFDSNPVALYTYLLKELDKRGIAFVEFVEPFPEGVDKFMDPEGKYPFGSHQIKNCAATFRPFFSGTLICNNGLTPDTALEKIQEGEADLVSFGRLFIANPDLPLRVKNNWPLAQPDQATFYQGKEKGYTDYPFYEQSQSQ